MASPLSGDLRERVVAAIEAGASCREAARRFEVSPASSVRWHGAFVQEGRTQTGTLVALFVRVRILNWRMERASARLSYGENAADSAALLAGAREWVRLHIRLATMFDIPMPPNVAELRDLFGEAGGSKAAKPPSDAHPDHTAAVLPK